MHVSQARLTRTGARARVHDSKATHAIFNPQRETQHKKLTLQHSPAREFTQEFDHEVPGAASRYAQSAADCFVKRVG